MGNGEPTSYRTLADLHRAVRALAEHFGADAVVVVGSQAILASYPDAPAQMRASMEFDAYPGNAAEWEAIHGVEASEEVNALFGYLSDFHRMHGFYIDGVDEATAMLPPDWKLRQLMTPVDCHGRTVHAVTPEIHDLLVSKLCRLETTDGDYVRAFHGARPLELELLRTRLAATDAPADVKARANRFLDGLAKS